VKIREIVFDCHRPAMLARFWAELLDGFDVRAYDEEEIARLAALGLTPESDPIVMVDGPGLKLGFQKTDPRPVSKNKVHLDLTVNGLDQAVAQALAIGAAVVERFDHHAWLRDPEGNDFCLTESA
jgi:hypothetical protein